jgi:hypothetical protein
VRLAATTLLVALAACSATPERPREPFVVVLGTAQDGGFPQVGCREPACARARDDEDHRRLVT